MSATPYTFARDAYAELGSDTELVLKQLGEIPISLQCWQGDDVLGFESNRAGLSGGIQATGNYPGRARNIEELRQDLDQAFSLIPGNHRLNLHAIYGDFAGQNIGRDAISISHFQSWIDWCRERGLGLDFNPSFFSHPLAASGATLSHRDPAVRQFWIQHGILARRIGAEIGRQLGSSCVTNVWVPDGSKDLPADRKAPRERLESSLDAIFAEPLTTNLDAVESKLFGIGSEAYVVGSHEFYLGYCVTRQKVLCLDAGHFHPTEALADKITSTLQFVPEILLHLSRGVRWDSDHVVLLDDPTRSVMEELVRGEFLNRVHLGLDFFDASINRIAAWTIGARNAMKALLIALLEPSLTLKSYEDTGDHTSRLALLEELKTMPYAAVWDEFCLRQNKPSGRDWMKQVKAYEQHVLAHR